MTGTTGRKVTANLALTLDGRYHGPGGPADFGMFVPYVTSEVARDHLTRIYEGATTALLGRGNAEGFMGFWLAVAGDAAPIRATAGMRSGWSAPRRWCCPPPWRRRRGNGPVW
ncbi:hypothetical protein ACFQY7_11760 [Actinomadura luteofluorescens]|uniref:hypothetical protein n=1 Tax=Actinomadura luteofluorescens TaxID=46163 RepID=UPI00363BA980